MIYYFCAPRRDVTTRGLTRLADPAVPICVRSYDRLFQLGEISLSAAIFTDFDRLPYDDHARASAIAARMQAAGVRVLNRPSHVRQRYELLRHLHDAGLNPFQIWRAEDRPRIAPDRFPVFLKSEGSHGHPVGGLLESQAALDAQIDALADMGQPVRHFLVTQFCNTPTRPGIWTRLTTYRVGDDVFAGLAVFEDSPFVKYGTYGLAEEPDFALALDIYRENRHAAALRRFFDEARIDYGRADFAVVDGTPVLYEINTNPTIPHAHKSRNSDYLAASRALQRRVGDAVAALGGPEISVTF